MEIDEALDAFKAHNQMSHSKMSAQPIEERILALEKAIKKSLEEPVRRTAPQSTQGMGGRPTYVSVVAPPAIKAAVLVRVEGADKFQPSDLLNKAKYTLRKHTP